MISKSKNVLKSNPDLADDLIAVINTSNIVSNEYLADVLIEACYKQDKIRPELFLDKSSLVSQKLLNSPEKQQAFSKRIEEFQKMESLMHELMMDDKAELLQDADIIDMYKSSMKFNPAFIDNGYAVAMEKMGVNTLDNNFGFGDFPSEANEYNPNFVLSDVKIVDGINDEIDLIENTVNSPEIDLSNDMNEKVFSPIAKIDGISKTYQESMKELLNEFEQKYTYEKSLLSFKSKAFNSATGTTINIQKHLSGGYSLSSGTGTPSEDLATMMLKGDGVIRRVPDPETDEDFNNVVEAWSMLKDRGYDLSNIQLKGDLAAIPQRYHDTLKSIQENTFDFGIPDVNLDDNNDCEIGLVDVVDDEKLDKIKSTANNDTVVIDDNPFDNTDDDIDPDIDPELEKAMLLALSGIDPESNDDTLDKKNDNNALDNDDLNQAERDVVEALKIETSKVDLHEKSNQKKVSRKRRNR